MKKNFLLLFLCGFLKIVLGQTDTLGYPHSALTIYPPVAPYCIDQAYCFSTDSLPGVENYNWEFEARVTVISNNGHQICVKFHNLGTIKITVTPDGYSPTFINYHLKNLPTNVQDFYYVCEEKFPAIIEGIEFHSYDRQWEYVPAKGPCEEFKLFRFKRIEPVYTAKTVFKCRNDIFEINGNLFEQPGEYEILIPNVFIDQCDEHLKLSLKNADPIPTEASCIYDEFLNGFSIDWNINKSATDYEISINSDTTILQKHTSYFYLLKANETAIDLKIQPTNPWGCVFEPSILTCVVPTSDLKTVDSERIQIQPNPSGGKFSISTNLKIKKVGIFNVSGKQILVSKNKEIDLSYFPAGVYFFKIETKNIFFVKKVVKL